MNYRMKLLALQADLGRLGFGAGGSISGNDTVDVLNHHIDVLLKLPALGEVLDAVECLRRAKGRFHTEQNYAALVEAFDKLEAK